MADPLVQTSDHHAGLLIPPLDTDYFSQQFTADDDVVLEDLGLEFCFDDLWIPSAEELDDLLNPSNGFEFEGLEPAPDSNYPQFAPISDQHQSVFKSNVSEIESLSEDCIRDATGVLNSTSSGSESNQLSGYLNVPSPETTRSNRECSEKCIGDSKVLNCPSPEFLGSDSCGSNVSHSLNNRPPRSVPSSPDLNNSSTSIGVVDQTIELEEGSKNKSCCSSLKRKKYCEDLMDTNTGSRINKCKVSFSDSHNNNDNNSVLAEEEKRNARLMRNRESAQLSRQRKKHYMEELEEKVKMMSSTIQGLNAKISYFMAENATLRQQINGGGGVPPPISVPPPPGMYAPPGMVYPWMPYPPPYMMKPQGSSVPLVPIPKLKSQRQEQAPKTTKKPDNKKNAGRKTKKVAGISFLGLLFFVLLFGGLAPFVNTRYGGVREALTGEESYVGGGIYKEHQGRVLVANGTGFSNRRDIGCKSSVHCGERGCSSGGNPSDDEFVRLHNASEPLVASLYVPRNDKLVKIDGNLIIHSILASEKAISSDGGRFETSLAIPGDLGAGIPVPGMGTNGARHPHLKALGPSSTGKEDSNPKAASDGRLQQWFHEGFAGPMLSSGMCTEVFQFDVSSAIVPSATTRNNSGAKNQNITSLSRRRNRRILRSVPIPFPEPAHNITRHNTDRNPQKENLTGNNSISPLVVSVLVDPREAADADVDGVIGPKPLSRIFVVVLIDSVKYVTYSCILPFKGAVMQPLVTA